MEILLLYVGCILITGAAVVSTIDLLRTHSAALTCFWQLAGDVVILVPGFVAMALMVGCQNRHQCADVRRINEMREVVWTSELASYQATRTFGLIQPRIAIGVLDMLIAQTAITLGLPLYTHNVKHFSAVAKLEVIRPFIA